MESFFYLEKFAHSRLFDNCQYPWMALLNIEKYFKSFPLGKIESPIPSDVTLINKDLISIGKSTLIESGTYIVGPCIIGDNCQIRQGAYLRGEVITGNQCVIGHGTEIKKSILLDRACASHFNYVGDSILGNDINLGAGLICANLRLDHKNITVFFKGEKLLTSFKKLGALIGDGSQLGCNCVLNPGTLIGKNVFCLPLLKISGYILPNSIIKYSIE